jgi:hypothetical protein
MLVPDRRIRPGHIALARNAALQTGCGPLSLARVRLLRNNTAQRAAPAAHKLVLCRLPTASRAAVAGSSSTAATRKQQQQQQQQRRAELTVAAVRTALQQLALSSQCSSGSVSSGSVEQKQPGTTVMPSSTGVSNGHPLDAAQTNGAAASDNSASADSLNTIDAIRGTLLLANGAVITLELPAILSTTAGVTTNTTAIASTAASAGSTTVRVDFAVQLVSTATAAAAAGTSSVSSTAAIPTAASTAAAASVSKAAVGLEPPLYMLLDTDSSVETLLSSVQLGVDAEWSTGLSSCVSLWAAFEAGPTCSQLGGVQEALRTGECRY